MCVCVLTDGLHHIDVLVQSEAGSVVVILANVAFLLHAFLRLVGEIVRPSLKIETGFRFVVHVWHHGQPVH